EGDGSVPPSMDRRGVRLRVAIYLENTIREIHDPVVLDPRAGVQAPFLLSVEVETRLGHLDGEHRVGRVRRAVIGGTAWHHGQIGLGLRLLVKRYGCLESHDPSWGKNSPQRVIDSADRRRVVGTLRLGDDQLAGDQLDRGALERTEIHEPIVLDTPPTP